MWKKIIALTALLFLFSGVRAGEIKEVLIIGNSIMKHGKAPQLGWNYDWGMAATAEEKDYAHTLHRMICEFAKQEKAPELRLERISNEKEMKGWDKLKGNQADIIVIQISDNYRGKQNKEEFQDNYSQMIKDLRGDRKPVILCLSNWGGGQLARMIEEAAKENKTLFVDLGPLSANPENKAQSEGNFTHGGVNWHPGDRGMKAIAEAAFNALKPRL